MSPYHISAGVQEALRIPGVPGLVAACGVASHHGNLSPEWATAKYHSFVRSTGESRFGNSSTWKGHSDWGKKVASNSSFSDLDPSKDLEANDQLKATIVISCVVDADRLDVESVEKPERAAVRHNYPSMQAMSEKLDHIRCEIASGRSTDLISADDLAHIRRAAELPTGFFSLSVPSGKGKIHSSLLFGVDHVINKGMDRIIYVVESAERVKECGQIIRECFKDPYGKFVVEFERNPNPENKAWYDTSHPAIDNCDAPIMIMQVNECFDSLFTLNSSRLRKGHNMTNCSLIIDKSQMRLGVWMRSYNEIIKELTLNYKT